uniref:Uncharacterized protein n=1 Tax=Heliothis virescens TaxID=7102 RepID=A0A2A4JGY6_HELVI
MRSLLLVILLAAAATAFCFNTDMAEAPEMVVTYEDVDAMTVADLPLTAVAKGSNINVGIIGGRTRLLARSAHIRSGIPGTKHVRDITFSTDNPIRITAIRVTHVGSLEGATSAIQSGGVGSGYVTIRLQSAVGHGYHYNIEIYGH